jgi:hypothetical protein
MSSVFFILSFLFFIYFLVYTIVIHQHHLKKIYSIYLLWKLKTFKEIARMRANSSVKPTTTNASYSYKIISITKVSSNKLFHCLIGFNFTFYLLHLQNCAAISPYNVQTTVHMTYPIVPSPPHRNTVTRAEFEPEIPHRIF